MIFDYDDGDYLYNVSDNMATDFDGDMYMRIGDNYAMDMNRGDLHYVSGWDDEDDED